LRLVTPERLAGFSVERSDLVSGRDRVDDAVNDDRRFLKAHGDVAAMSDPGDRKLADIILVDLIERTVSPGVGSPIVLRPVIRVFRARFGRESETRSTEQAGKSQARRRRRFAHCILPDVSHAQTASLFRIGAAARTLEG